MRGKVCSELENVLDPTIWSDIGIPCINYFMNAGKYFKNNADRIPEMFCDMTQNISF